MAAGTAGLHRFTVDVWHPECWTLRATRETDAGLLGHGTAIHGDRAVGRYTAYGESTDAVEALVAFVRESGLTEAITPLASSQTGTASALGPATREVVVEFDPGPSIRDAFTSRGLVHHGPTRHEDGRERRSFLGRIGREAVGRAIDDIAAAYGADLELERLATPASDRNENDSSADRLSPRQRDAFRLARSRGYYGYPRGVTARELAAELDVSKATFLEHLRKAEAKLLGRIDLR